MRVIDVTINAIIIKISTTAALFFFSVVSVVFQSCQQQFWTDFCFRPGIRWSKLQENVLLCGFNERIPLIAPNIGRLGCKTEEPATYLGTVSVSHICSLSSLPSLLPAGVVKHHKAKEETRKPCFWFCMDSWLPLSSHLISSKQLSNLSNATSFAEHLPWSLLFAVNSAVKGKEHGGQVFLGLRPWEGKTSWFPRQIWLESYVPFVFPADSWLKDV